MTEDLKLILIGAFGVTIGILLSNGIDKFVNKETKRMIQAAIQWFVFFAIILLFIKFFKADFWQSL